MGFQDVIGGIVGAPRCFGCGMRGSPLCSRCEARARRPAGRVRVPWVRTVVAAWEYEDAARALILALKLEGRRDAAPPLAAAMAAAVATAGLRGDVVTWVPGRPADTRERGFDHAELLAGLVGPRIGLPVARLLLRRRSAPDQAGLNAAQRRRNLVGAFGATSCDGVVVVVDDLITTGATARACASALRRSGAQAVELVVAAGKS